MKQKKEIIYYYLLIANGGMEIFCDKSLHFHSYFFLSIGICPDSNGSNSWSSQLYQSSEDTVMQEVESWAQIPLYFKYLTKGDKTHLALYSFPWLVVVFLKNNKSNRNFSHNLWNFSHGDILSVLIPDWSLSWSYILAFYGKFKDYLGQDLHFSLLYKWYT